MKTIYADKYRQIGLKIAYYRKLRGLTQEQLASVKSRMQEIVSADMPFRKEKIDAVTAEKMFEENNQPEKAELQKSLGKFGFLHFKAENYTLFSCAHCNILSKIERKACFTHSRTGAYKNKITLIKACKHFIKHTEA